MPKNILTVAAAVLGLAGAALGGYFLLNKPSVTAGAPTGSASGATSTAVGASTPAAAGSAPRPASVEVTQVERASLQDDAQAVGTLRSRQQVMLRPEVAGRVQFLGFADGATVRQGQLMVQLDDVLQRAEVKQAQAQVSLAQANFQRNQELVAQNFVAKRVLDESGAGLQVAQAQLSLSCARLVRMRIEAPFSGSVGIRSVNLGDYVKDGADLVNLEDMGTMVADFRLPERVQSRVKRGQTVELQLDAMPNRLFKATIEAIDPALDANGRSVGVRAALPNTGGEPLRGPAKAASAAQMPSAKRPNTTAKSPASATPAPPLSPELQSCRATERAAPPPQAAREGNGPLRPGMFVRATAIFGVKTNALTVPEESIVPQGGRQFVIKLVDRSTVTATAALSPDVTLVSQRTEVKLGLRRQGRVEVEAAGPVPLAAGDTVVTAGQQRLQRDATGVRVVDLSRPVGAPMGTASAPGPISSK